MKPSNRKIARALFRSLLRFVKVYDAHPQYKSLLQLDYRSLPRLYDFESGKVIDQAKIKLLTSGKGLNRSGCLCLVVHLVLFFLQNPTD
jgi:hypothetical protein